MHFCDFFFFFFFSFFLTFRFQHKIILQLFESKGVKQTNVPIVLLFFFLFCIFCFIRPKFTLMVKFALLFAFSKRTLIYTVNTFCAKLVNV